MAGALSTEGARQARPYEDAVAVSKSDTADIAFTGGGNLADALWIGGTGDVTVVMESGVTVTFKAVPVGWLEVRCTRLKSTNTSATDVVAVRGQ